ncbi:MAG: recombinase family protein, partial [Pseudomonadota bacterium]
GMEAARKKGKHIGRPHSLDEEAILEGHRYVMQEKLPIHAAASRLKVSHATLTRGFKRMGLSLI